MKQILCAAAMLAATSTASLACPEAGQAGNNNMSAADYSALSSKRADLRTRAARDGWDAAFASWLADQPNLVVVQRGYGDMAGMTSDASIAYEPMVDAMYDPMTGDPVMCMPVDMDGMPMDMDYYLYVPAADLANSTYDSSVDMSMDTAADVPAGSTTDYVMAVEGNENTAAVNGVLELEASSDAGSTADYSIASTSTAPYFAPYEVRDYDTERANQADADVRAAMQEWDALDADEAAAMEFEQNGTLPDWYAGESMDTTDMSIAQQDNSRMEEFVTMANSDPDLQATIDELGLQGAYETWIGQQPEQID